MIPFIEDVDGSGVRHTEIFRLALLGKANNEDWKELLANFRACMCGLPNIIFLQGRKTYCP